MWIVGVFILCPCTVAETHLRSSGPGVQALASFIMQANTDKREIYITNDQLRVTFLSWNITNKSVAESLFGELKGSERHFFMQAESNGRELMPLSQSAVIRLLNSINLGFHLKLITG